MTAFLLTFQLIVVAVLIAAALGLPGAWALWTVEQFGRSGKGLGWLARAARWIANALFISLIVTIALPMILHAAAWEATAGKFGWLALTQTGARSTGDAYTGFAGVFGGLVAAGWIHGVHGSVIVAIATWAGVRRTPRPVIQRAQLEMSPTLAWWRIYLPIAMPWVATGLLAVAALATTEMCVVDLYGYRTVTDLFYLQFAIDASSESVVRVCALPLVFILAILFVVRTRLVSQRSVQSAVLETEDSGVGSPHFADAVSPLTNLTAMTVAVGFVCLTGVVPVLGLVIKLGHEVEVQDTVRKVSWSAEKCLENLLLAPGTFHAEYTWTAVIAASTAVAAVTFAWLAAVAGRENSTARGWLDILAIGMVLIPGPIVALAVVRSFQIDWTLARTLYHETIVPTCIALVFRAGPVAYWIMRSAYQGVGERVTELAKTEMSFTSRVWNVDRPLLARAFAGAVIASAIVASGDVPAMLPVVPPGVTTVGTRLFEQLHSGARYQEASLAIWYVMAVSIVASIWIHVLRRTHARAA